MNAQMVDCRECRAGLAQARTAEPAWTCMTHGLRRLSDYSEMRPPREWFLRQLERLTENGEQPTPLGWFVAGYEHGRMHATAAVPGTEEGEGQ